MSRHNWGKIVQGIYDSSIFFAGPVNRAIFMDSVVLAEEDNIVHYSPMSFARKTGWSPDQIREAYSIHTSPDPNSTTKDHEGRRWIMVDPKNDALGFLVVNRDQYKRETAEQARSRKRTKQRRDRSNNRANSRVNIITDNVTVMKMEK